MGASDPLRPTSFTSDGKQLAYVERDRDIWILPLDLTDSGHPKSGKPEPFLATPAKEDDPAFSPDGRWMAYTSSESGRPEVYVRPFSGPGGKWRVSTAGGQKPVWSRTARDMLFQGPDERIMVSEYTVQGESLNPGKPHAWSPTDIQRAGPFASFDLHPDGKRLIVLLSPQGEESKGNLHATFVLNFANELRRRIPEVK
jgi:serine/threonine-protein kinase